jgi:hypothetical protein
MVRTPSSQPEGELASGNKTNNGIPRPRGLKLTSDDLADADLDDEVTAADGRVEPR